MAWPPPVLSINKQNSTVMQDDHPAAHNAERQAINDTVTKVTALEGELKLRVGTAAFMNGNIAVAPGSLTDFSAFTEAYDPQNFLEPTTGRVTVPAAYPGMYMWTLTAIATAGVTSTCDVHFYNASTTTILAIGYMAVGKTYVTLAGCFPIDAGQQVVMRFYNGQASGNVSVKASFNFTRVSLS